MSAGRVFRTTSVVRPALTRPGVADNWRAPTTTATRVAVGLASARTGCATLRCEGTGIRVCATACADAAHSSDAPITEMAVATRDFFAIIPIDIAPPSLV